MKILIRNYEGSKIYGFIYKNGNYCIRKNILPDKYLLSNISNLEITNDFIFEQDLLKLVGTKWSYRNNCVSILKPVFKKHKININTYLPSRTLWKR